MSRHRQFPQTLSPRLRAGAATLALVVALGAWPAGSAHAQDAGRGSRTTPASATSSHVDVREVTLPVQQVRALQDSLERQSEPAGEKGPLGLNLGGGNKRLEAAEAVLRQIARGHVATSNQTVVVVIGSENDRTKVVDSLADVQRRVAVLFVNDSAKSATFDNTAIRGGLLNRPARIATNMWIYLPETTRAATDTPSQVLSTRVAAKALWTTLFGLDGDVPSFSRNSNSSGGNDAPASPSSTAAPTPSATFRPEEVVIARIGGVKVLERPADDARVLATLTRADEMVVTASNVDGFVKVQTPDAEGWVKTTLIVRQE